MCYLTQIMRRLTDAKPAIRAVCEPNHIPHRAFVLVKPVLFVTPIIAAPSQAQYDQQHTSTGLMFLPTVSTISSIL